MRTSRSRFSRGLACVLVCGLFLKQPLKVEDDLDHSFIQKAKAQLR